jgi:hypothetical protein
MNSKRKKGLSFDDLPIQSRYAISQQKQLLKFGKKSAKSPSKKRSGGEQPENNN